MGALRDFLPVAVQVGLVGLLLVAFRVESPAFHRRVVPIVLAGFLVHHFLPRRLQLGFFLALSAGAIVAVFGVSQAPWLLALGGALVVTCHLPIAFRWRVALLLLAGAGLGVARAGFVTVPWSGAIWPILGSMFMFRLVAYMYDLRHQKGPVEWTRAFAYFFLLPNVAFPLFPVVDYATFKRTWFDQPALAIYREGVAWMLRGLTHLLLYRLIYERLTLSPGNVHTLGGYAQYAVANYGLYLRVSGQFHLIVGILHLFGFRLPETHRLFYFASSFSDFWRRINIYWKEFMMKVVFYPTFFGAKRWGERTGLALSVVAVFVVSWFTHSYQWFWILGEWLFSATDAVFWAIFGTIMVFTSLREAKAGRVRQLGGQPTWRQSARAGFGTIGVFSFICALWTLWNSPSFAEYLETLRAARFTWGGAAGIVIGLLVLWACALFAHRFVPPPGRSAPGTLRRSIAANFAVLGALWLFGNARVVPQLPPSLGTLALDLRAVDLNARDADQLQRGYYESLTGVSARNGQLWDLYAERGQDDPDLREVGVMRETNDPLRTELVPLQAAVFGGKSFRTNRFGMRDQDYQEIPPLGTYRVALLGQSYVLGMGVGDREVFEGIAERAIDRERRARGEGGFEILNFGMPRWSLGQQALIAENGRIARFHPHAVVVVGHALDFDRVMDWVHLEAGDGRAIPDSALQAAVAPLHLGQVSSSHTAQQLLTPMREPLVRWALERVASAARSMGAERLLYVAIPMPSDTLRDANVDLVLRLAREAGFEVHDLWSVYEGRDPTELRVAAWDRHPNAIGHQLIARRFEALIREEFFRPRGVNASVSGATRVPPMNAPAGRERLSQ